MILSHKTTISTYLLTVLLATLVWIACPAKASGTCEQFKIIDNLQDTVDQTPLFYGCPVGLFDSNEPQHAQYYANLNAISISASSILDKLYNKYTPRQLHYFYEFKERLYLTRQHGIYKKDAANYCILYSQQFDAKLKPWNIHKDQKYYEQVLSKCDATYEKFCCKINKLESLINEQFLHYYSFFGFSPNSSKSLYDYGLVQFANGNLAESVDLANAFLEQVKKENKDLTSFPSHQLLDLGITYNEAMQYSQAIDLLNASIETDSLNKEAYFQRAIAFLETGLFDQAINDFLVSEKSKNSTVLASKVSEEFTQAFINGLTEGSSEAVIDFFPSLFSFAYTATAHPIDSLANFISACHSLMLATNDYLNEVSWSQIEDVSGLGLALIEPGLKKLYDKTKELSPTEQGHLLGHNIGFYGVDFIAGVMVTKGLSNVAKLSNACKTVRESGRIYELETLVGSEIQNKAILSEAIERSKQKAAIINCAKNSRIVVKHPNAQFHIMQKKHAWDKLIPLSGDVKKDYKKVVHLLEKHKILNDKYLVESKQFNHLMRSDYRITIDGCEIKAIFETDTLAGTTFLNDAWVVTQ